MSFSIFKTFIEENDTVILYVGISQIYAIEVKAMIKNKHGILVEYTFQTKYGALRVIDLVGKRYGAKIQLTRGYAIALYPTPELWTLTLPHRTQILYTPDISLICTELDLKPGSIVCEAGTGSGSLSHAIIRTISPHGHLYTCDFHLERVETVIKEFECHNVSKNVTVRHRDVCEIGWGVNNEADAVFLDVPRPWDALKHAIEAIKLVGGRICSFSPCIEQVSRCCERMKELGLTDINTTECLQREFQFRSMHLPSVSFKFTDDLEVSDIDKNSSNSKKKLKLEESASDTSTTLEHSVKECENNSKVANNCVNSLEKTSKSVENSKTSKNCPKEESQFVRTAVPLLKMPGHTGYLTFATVPPRLKKTEYSFSDVKSISSTTLIKAQE